MRPVNTENGMIMLKMPAQLKKLICEEAEKKGISMNAYVLQILWKQFEG